MRPLSSQRMAGATPGYCRWPAMHPSAVISASSMANGALTTVAALATAEVSGPTRLERMSTILTAQPTLLFTTSYSHPLMKSARPCSSDSASLWIVTFRS